MISGFLKKIFGSRNDRLIKQYAQTVKRINAFEPAIQALSDEQLRAKTDEFRQRHATGEALDDLMPEAFAVVPGFLAVLFVRFCGEKGMARAWRISA